MLLREPAAFRLNTLNQFIEPLTKLASHTDSGKNRNCLYSILKKFRIKITSLNDGNKVEVKLKRRIIGVDRKTKKLKYEVGTSTPFPFSLVPLPLL